MMQQTAPQVRIPSLGQMKDFVGQEVALTQWRVITQEEVDAFARITRDPDWMHIDPARARSGPLGHTIVQGFFTLALLTSFSHETHFLPADIAYAFNYGLDRVRWVQPLKVGARVRNRTVLLEVQNTGERRYTVKTRNTVEIEGVAAPAMVADWLALLQGIDPSRSPTEQSQWPGGGN